MTSSRHGAANGAAAHLPAAERERWQLVRSGLLNLYRYDYEEFRFEQGRMLLRGNNGTGKSRVLALQLPFLLDGEVAPHRLEPDGDQAKRIEWNLLLGKYTDRLGYTWIEFGRRDEHGDAHYLTLGCGLSAAEGRGLAGKWFFITPLRIGQDLYLQSEAGYPLTRERLVEAINGRGEVFNTAAAYRAAVDQALFHLGEHRYGALVTLLVELRKPQLSRQLDEGRLSRALSEALRPVSPAIIGDVAEAFRNLESDRATIDTFIAARRGADVFLTEYRRYAQIAARRRAEGVRTAHTAYETTMRKLRSAEGTLETASRNLADVCGRIEQLGLDERAAAAVVETLNSTPQMRNADALASAQRLAGDRHQEAERIEHELDHAEADRAIRDGERASAEQAAGASRSSIEQAAARARVCAGAIGLEREYDAAIEHLALPDVQQLEHVTAATHRANDLAGQRQRASRLVRTLNHAADSARHAYEAAKTALTGLSAQLDDAIETQRQAHRARDVAADALLGRYHAWTDQVEELVPPPAEEIADTLAEWCRTTDGTNPVAVAVRDATAAAMRSLAALGATTEQRRADEEARLHALRVERAHLQAGNHAPPPPPYTRGEGVRVDRAGAPLWLLCDFRPEVPPPLRAGLEAALEAAGLLDAWVTPDGRLLAADEHDTVLIATAHTRTVPDQHLGAFLLPAIDRTDSHTASINDGTIDQLLQQIGVGSEMGTVWVDTDGRWQLGPLRGAWTKDAAQHIGALAREANRRERLRVLDRACTDAEELLETLHVDLTRIGDRERIVRAEADAAPDDNAVRTALAAISAAEQTVDGVRKRVAGAEARVAECRRDMTVKIEERDTTARDLGVTTWVNDLQRLDDAIADYRRATDELWLMLHRHMELKGQLAAAERRAAQAMETEQRRRTELRDAQLRASTAAAERDTLQASIGAEVEDILHQLSIARARLARIQQTQNATNAEQIECTVQMTRAEHEIESYRAVLQQAERTRELAISALGTFVATRLLPTCDPQLVDIDSNGWSVTRAVDSARRIEAALSSCTSDDDAWARSQGQIYRHVQTLTETLLPHGYTPDTTMQDGIVVVSVPFQGRSCTVAELRTALDDEVTSRQALLNAREREILENHLIGEVSTHLHDLLHEGEKLAREMNDELRARPTSTGMTLRFTWHPADDAPRDLADVRKRLLRAGGTWSPAEREALGAFLQRQIQAVRAANDTGTWQEHLATALDYRAWHQFNVERQQDGQWKRLTRRTHGTGSGGEKAIALTIPQFAAAAAHYRTADPLAPRLIALDEAFVGIDTDMRSKCMGLLNAFDLDFMMTSEREWGCYVTLPGIAIYQLSTRPDVDAVGVTRWVWNGQQRVRADQMLPSAAPPVASSPATSS